MDIINTEFYNTPDGIVMVKHHGKAVYELTISHRDLIQEMLALIRNRYTPNTFAALSELYSKNERNRMLYEYNMVSRFCRCNFGEYDQFKYDIDYKGQFCLEEVRCPLRGSGDCPYEGVICKPDINTILTDRENEIIKLIADGMQAQEIADELHISTATVNRHRENIKCKLDIRNINEIVSYYHNNLKR